MVVARRWAAAVLLAMSLSACGAMYGSDNFWDDAGFWDKGQAGDAAMAALSKGDFTRAEQLGNDAMRRNPKDPYALLTLAVVYENTGRSQLARQYYEVLVSMNPQATALVGVGPANERRPVAEIAAQHLTLLGNPPAGQGPADPVSAHHVRSTVPPPPTVSPLDMGSSDDANIIVRFQTLRRLLDEGLITREEYNQRRGANLGALLPYSSPLTPAAQLGRPAPAPEQVAQRLHYLSSAYQERSISAREQVAERTVILDALLPANPAVKADPPPPVTEQLQAAALVGRLEKMRVANVITADEQAREKSAVFRSVEMTAAQAQAAARSAAGLAPPPTAPTGPGIRLSSYGSEARARRAWSALRKAHPAELGGLQAVVRKVTLRRRGVLYRLNAGPLVDRKAALALCRRLRHGGQACEPTILAP